MERLYPNVIANKLIESGLVEIEEEPREFWIIRTKYNGYMELHAESVKCFDPTKEIIHVHSVEQCKKYEKMWNELKKLMGNYVVESTFSKANILGIMQRFEQLEKGA